MKNPILWTLAVFITIVAVLYQRATGPSYPKKFKIKTETGIVKIKLLRSETTGKNAIISINCTDTSLKGIVEYKHYPTDEDFVSVPMVHQGNMLQGELPYQPPAGKLAYRVVVFQNGSEIFRNEEPVVIRFKGEVPDLALIPHIFLIFLAMLFSNYCGLLAIWGKKDKLFKYSLITVLLLTIGGMILGPVVQHYAFGQAWTGVPFGWDLTDNKTLFAYIIWLIALLANRKQIRPGWILAAAIVLLLIYSIPHSMFGSELDYSTGQVVTGE